MVPDLPGIDLRELWHSRGLASGRKSKAFIKKRR